VTNLSLQILDSKWVSEIEELLLASLKDVELIGELYITKEVFDKISIALRDQCRFRGKIQPENLYPAIFMVSLVFSGRYSHDETRKFWGPYSRDVWNIKLHTPFYTACRQYFQFAKQELTEKFGFEFPVINDGDVVRAIYWHTIIPSYLHDDFARWLSKNLGRISKLPTQQVSEFIKDPNETKYLARTLKAFLIDDDTHDMAVEIVNELVAASDLLASQQDVMEIKQLFPSLIQQELWDKFVEELEVEALESLTPQRHVRLEWVWSFEYEDWVLRLLNLITESHEKPSLCVWSQVKSKEALWNNDYQDEIWAELQPNRHWRIREVVLGTANKSEMIDGFVYVYDEHDNCIYEQAVPSLPCGKFQFYRITQQQKYAVPVDYSQVTSGECLVSYVNSLELRDTDGYLITPIRSDFDISKTMREQVGHEHIGLFKVHLPLVIHEGVFQYRIELTKRRFLNQPTLSSNYRIPNTSDRLPPVYNSNRITLNFDEVAVAIKHLRIHLTTPNGQLYKSFERYAKADERGYSLDLSQLIPDDRIGTYTVDITYGFKSRLASPIEFSVLPHLEFSELDNTHIYNPLNPPRILIKNVTTEILESPNKLTEIEPVNGNEWQVTWTDLRLSYCRLHIQQYTQIVPLEWQIQRVYAWFEASTLPNHLLLEDLDKARIQFRGQGNTQLALYVDNSYHPVYLNARGEETYNLFTDKFKDILLNQSASVVPLEIAFNMERWLLGTFVHRPQITRFQMDYLVDDNKEWLLLDVKLSESWETVFEIQIISNKTQQTILATTVNTLENPILLNCHLLVGTYVIRIFAEDDELEIPSKNTLSVRAPFIVMEASYDSSNLTVQVSYELDDLRLGDYVLNLLDSNGEIVLSEPIDSADNQFSAIVDLISHARYTAQIRWNDRVIGEALPIFVSGQMSSIAKAPINSTSDTAPLLKDNMETWLHHLIQHPPEKLSQETLFQLATLNPQNLQNYTIEELSGLWKPLARLAEVNRPSYWMETYGLLPAWSLLNHAVMMTTNEEQSYWVYPEKILLHGTMGIGKIILDTPQEGKIGGYARWSMRNMFSSRLHVWIPQIDPQKSAYSDLDELDMYPAYYDRLSGKFHGARRSAMIPGFNQEKGTYLVDCVHNYTLLVRINRTSQPLLHMNTSLLSFDRNYTQSILRQQDDLQTKSQNKKKITTAAGYRYATVEWVENYIENKEAKKQLKALVDTADIAGKLSLLLKKIPNILQLSNTTLLIGALRFLKGMEEQVTTQDEHSLMRLDCHMLALAIILRAYSLETQSTKQAILNSIEIDEIELMHLLADANHACPTLLEWALTWSEIFITHGST